MFADVVHVLLLTFIRLTISEQQGNNMATKANLSQISHYIHNY